MDFKLRVNNQIRASQLRVIDEEGNNLGVLSIAEALKEASARGTDLIEISPNAVPPVAKIMDFGKYQYVENKKKKLAKAKTQTTEIKNVQLGIATGDHDLELIAKRSSKFLSEGNKVKIRLTLRGRAKYMDKTFLRGRIERMLKLITEKYKISDDIKPGPKGLMMTIEKVN